MNSNSCLRLCYAIFWIAWTTGRVIGAVPELREQVSLNGTWEFTPAGKDKTAIPVPEYWDARPGFKTSQALYERQVTVPESFAGKRVRLEFEGVNHIAQVSVNGKEVGSHIGGWIPFATRVLASDGGCIIRNQYATLFRSQGAYKNNNRFIRLIVKE